MISLRPASFVRSQSGKGRSLHPVRLGLGDTFTNLYQLLPLVKAITINFMKSLVLYRTGRPGEVYRKGERAETHPQDFVQDIQILHDGKMVAVCFNRSHTKIFSGIPFEYAELNEEGDSFYLPRKK